MPPHNNEPEYLTKQAFDYYVTLSTKFDDGVAKDLDEQGKRIGKLEIQGALVKFIGGAVGGIISTAVYEGFKYYLSHKP